ncbi:MAG: hypothetical protein JXP36_00950 [Bacteroidales bacterium]|nr:hypothetical protein [Bacteroidales bacterium]MBN2817503.1 hypothetical protein [Bacteroidales bacterium]
MIKKIILILFLIKCTCLLSQSDVMMQAFYWDVPVDAELKNGFWYDSLTSKIPELKEAGIKEIWLPPSSKGNWGIYDMGYGIYDHYDLGKYFQLGTHETRFGSYEELKQLIETAHDTTNEQRMIVLADVVLNHMYSYQAKDYEVNPVLQDYIYREAVIADTSRYPYPVNEIVWRITNSSEEIINLSVLPYQTEDFQNWDGTLILQTSYDISELMKSATNDAVELSENKTISIGESYVANCKHAPVKMPVHANTEDTIFAKLNLFNVLNEQKVWVNQCHGISIKSGQADVKVMTSTGIHYVQKKTEPQLCWNYNCFHPGYTGDFLNEKMTDEKVTESMKWFGHDINHYHPEVLTMLSDWGRWLIDSVGYDGYRLDFVQGIDEQFIMDWRDAVWLEKEKAGPMVAEYFTSVKQRIFEWSEKVNKGSNINTKVFDFPLKFALTAMCNSSGADFDMQSLNYAGLCYDSVYALPAEKIVSFVENHDTGKESDKWIEKDWFLAYAYILFAPMQPCVYYNHFYGIDYTDIQDHSKTVSIPAGLKQDIKVLIKLRASVLTGEMNTVNTNNRNLFAACRESKQSDNKVWLLINNSDTDSLSYFIPGRETKNPGKVSLVNIPFHQAEISEMDSAYQVLVYPRSACLVMTKADAYFSLDY